MRLPERQAEPRMASTAGAVAWPDHCRDNVVAINPSARPPLTESKRRPSENDAWLSRGFDVVGSSLALIFFLPLMIVVAVLVRALDEGPVFYVHQRLGKGGRMFGCLKFRTMAFDAEILLATVLASNPAAKSEWQRVHKLRCDPRVTKLGKFLRQSSLDELPQLINVLRGEMSLVGPRPIVPDECHHYGRYLAEYCSVRPGITGLWQVSGRNRTSYRRRVALDVVYSRRASLTLDLVLIVRTIPSLLRGDGC